MDPERLISWIATASPPSDPLLDWFSRGGALGILAGVVVAFIRGWIVPAPEVTRLVSEIGQLRTERDRALELVYTSAATAQKALETLAESKEKWSHLDP